MKKQTKTQIPKLEKGNVLRDKMNRWLDQNSSSLSKRELRELRKGLQDLNPDMFYSLNDGGNDYQTFMKNSEGTWENKDAFGSGIDKKSGKTSSNRSGLLQSLTGGRRTSGYGGKENPRRIKDILTKAVELNYLRNIKSEQGNVEEDSDNDNDSNADETVTASNLDGLIGTTPTTIVSKDNIDYVVVDGQEIPVKIGTDGKIEKILSIEEFAIDAVDGTGENATFKANVDPYNTGVDMYDKANETSGTDDNQTTFTDGTAFQRFLIQKAKDKDVVIAKDVLKVKTKTGELLGIDYDGKVGSATMALARLLGYADLWVGSTTSTSSSTTSSTGGGNSTGSTGSTGNNSTGGSGTSNNSNNNSNNSSNSNNTSSTTQGNANNPYFPTTSDTDTEYGQKIAALKGNESLKYVQSLLDGFTKETGSKHPKHDELIKKHSNFLLASNTSNYEVKAEVDDTNTPLNLGENIKAINTGTTSSTTSKASTGVTSNPKKEGTATEKADIIRQANNSFRACKSGPCKNRQSILQLLQNYKDINNGQASSFESEVLEHFKMLDNREADKTAVKSFSINGMNIDLNKGKPLRSGSTSFNIGGYSEEDKKEELEKLNKTIVQSKAYYDSYKTQTYIDKFKYALDQFKALSGIDHKLATELSSMKAVTKSMKKGGELDVSNMSKSELDKKIKSLFSSMIKNDKKEEDAEELKEYFKEYKTKTKIEHYLYEDFSKLNNKQNTNKNIKKMSNGGIVELTDELRAYLDSLREFSRERELDAVVDSYKLGGKINYNQDGASTAVSRRTKLDDYTPSSLKIDKYTLSNSASTIYKSEIDKQASEVASRKAGKLVLISSKTGKKIGGEELGYYVDDKPFGKVKDMLEKQAIENEEVANQEAETKAYKAKFKAERDAKKTEEKKSKELSDSYSLRNTPNGEPTGERAEGNETSKSEDSNEDDMRMAGWKSAYGKYKDNIEETDIKNKIAENTNNPSDVYNKKAEAPILEKYPKGMTEEEFIARTGGLQDTRTIEEKIADEIRKTKQEENIENNTKNPTEEETAKAWEEADKKEAAKNPKFKKETTSDKANLESKKGSAMVKNLDKTYDYKRDNNGVWSYAKKGTNTFIPIDNSTKKGLEAEAKLNSFYEAGDSWSSKASKVGSADTYKDIKVDNTGEAVSASEWDKQANEELAKRSIESSMEGFDAGIDINTDVSEDIKASVNEAITSNDIVDIQPIPGDEMEEENVEEIRGLGMTRAKSAVKDFFTRDEEEKKARIMNRLKRRAERKAKRTSSYSSGGNLDRVNFIKRAVR